MFPSRETVQSVAKSLDALKTEIDIEDPVQKRVYDRLVALESQLCLDFPEYFPEVWKSMGV